VKSHYLFLVTFIYLFIIPSHSYKCTSICMSEIWNLAWGKCVSDPESSTSYVPWSCHAGCGCSRWWSRRCWRQREHNPIIILECLRNKKMTWYTRSKSWISFPTLTPMQNLSAASNDEPTTQDMSPPAQPAPWGGMWSDEWMPPPHGLSNTSWWGPSMMAGRPVQQPPTDRHTLRWGWHNNRRWHGSYSSRQPGIEVPVAASYAEKVTSWT
jgi:hypothetical protein